MQPGRFITVEGGEGVGKSLFLELLTQELQHGDVALIRTFEPGGTPVADVVRGLFKSPPADDPLLIETELFLVSAARVQHVEKKIKPALACGKWVLCDRFADSTRVYQGIVPGISEEKYEAIIQLSVGDFAPDLTFLLDCPLDMIMSRIGGRQTTAHEDKASIDRHDSASRDYHANLQRSFLAVARKFPERIIVLDSTEAPEQIVKKAVKIIHERFGA